VAPIAWVVRSISALSLVGNPELEPIKQALIKAKVMRGDERTLAQGSPLSETEKEPVWQPKQVELDPKHLEQHRVISFAMNDRTHIAFNLLRTKIYSLMKEKGWSTVAITSPTPECGKTMVAANLAFSLSRQSGCKTVLIDLDLRKPKLSRTMGIATECSIYQYLREESPLDQCFVQVTENLIVGCNDRSTNYSSELMLQGKFEHMLLELRHAISPSVVLFDLPPMLSGDETIAFLPKVDCCVLVIESGVTTPAQIDECERQASVTNFLGVVLNKCRDASNEHYYYGV
jgi:protein-tyrosine kinase